jgi:hypothetical protein
LLVAAGTIISAEDYIQETNLNYELNQNVDHG